MFRLPSDRELADQDLLNFIQRHNSEVAFRYQLLRDAYMTDYPIFRMSEKPKYKPDNRIAVNFAKYITDTMNGFFIGNPIKITSTDKDVEKYVNFLDQYNDQDDNNAELSKMCSIYGHAYEMYFVDEEGHIGITYVSPMEAFMIYDDSVLERERYFVRLYLDADNVLHGSVSDEERVRYFTQKGEIVWSKEKKPHGFDGVPATKYVDNAEEVGIFEPSMTMINAYNKAISEKANDVDYYADAYLKILGAKVQDDNLSNIRDNRIINFDGEDARDMIVDFLQKPNGDTTQENLIDRLERLIFQISMVANISDESFGASSGIALKYKLQAMSNLEKTKERKFISGMNRRYRLIFSNAVSGMKQDAWLTLKYQFSPNFPANLLEESQIAGNLAGISSQKTRLKVLSVVDDVNEEIERIKEEQADAYGADYPTNRTAEIGEQGTDDPVGGNNRSAGQGAERRSNTEPHSHHVAV